MTNRKYTPKQWMSKSLKWKRKRLQEELRLNKEVKESKGDK